MLCLSLVALLLPAPVLSKSREKADERSSASTPTLHCCTPADLSESWNEMLRGSFERSERDYYMSRTGKVIRRWQSDSRLIYQLISFEDVIVVDSESLGRISLWRLPRSSTSRLFSSCEVYPTRPTCPFWLNASDPAASENLFGIQLELLMIGASRNGSYELKFRRVPRWYTLMVGSHADLPVFVLSAPTQSESQYH